MKCFADAGVFFSPGTILSEYLLSFGRFDEAAKISGD